MEPAPSYSQVLYAIPLDFEIEIELAPQYLMCPPFALVTHLILLVIEFMSPKPISLYNASLGETFSWTLWPTELGPWPQQTEDTPDIEEQVQFQFRNPMGLFNLDLNTPKPIFKYKIQKLF